MITSLVQRPLAAAMFCFSCLVSTASPHVSLAQDPAQQSLAQHAVEAVLKQISIDPIAIVPKTKQPLSPKGSWSIAKEPPPSCPQGSQCATVIYRVPEADVLCKWTIALGGNDEATIVDQNADASRYMVRTLSEDQARLLVLSKSKPNYPPIAVVAHMGAEVSVRLVVSALGKPEGADIVSASNPMFSQYASEAAMGWKFKPLMLGTQAIRFQTTLRFTFASSGPGSVSVTSTP